MSFYELDSVYSQEKTVDVSTYSTPVNCLLKLPHTSRIFVVKLPTFCRGQVGFKFVGPSVRRTLADLLSRLTLLRLGAKSSKIKIAPIPLK